MTSEVAHTVASMEISHSGALEDIAAAMADLRERAIASADLLSEDGAQPHLALALTTAASALRAEERRLLLALRSDEDEQQQLAV